MADVILDVVQNDVGLSAEEALPALAIVAVTMALETSNPRQALDELVHLLDEEESEPTDTDEQEQQ